MTEHKNYHALLEDKIYMGGATNVEAMVKNEGIQVIVDLRGEATECAYPEAFAEWIQIPLGDNAKQSQELLFKKAIDEAEAKAKNIRNVIDLKSPQRESFQKLYRKLEKELT